MSLSTRFQTDMGRTFQRGQNQRRRAALDAVMSHSLYSRAPTRIDLAGGWTDLIPFATETEGAVLNTAIDLYVYVTLAASTGQSVSLYAKDLNHRFDPLPASAPLRGVSLPQAVLSRLHPHKGCHLVTWSDAPRGSGLGASGAMGIALVGLLSAFASEELECQQLVDIANAIERETGIPCGKQDHCASLLGGFNFLRFQGERVHVTPLRLEEHVVENLQKSLLLVYTGESHFSGEILQNVVDAYQAGNRKTYDALTALRRIAAEMKTALEKTDLSGFGEMLDENWYYQRQLHPSVSTTKIDELFELAKTSGCTGGKACGAGGGGCLVFYCPPDRVDPVAKTLSKAGAKVMPFRFDLTGLRIWFPPNPEPSLDSYPKEKGALKESASVSKATSPHPHVPS